MERKNAWKEYGEEQLAQLEQVARGYIAFISENKTERECAAAAIAKAEEAGYMPLEECIAQGRALKPGDKVWAHTHGKALMLVHLGSRPLQEGLNILGAHIDSPRLDLKQNPLYESHDLALLDTHYYGGIKKYQWVTLPLALHGVVALKDGSVVPVVVGEDPSDPVFCITDILPHLGAEQMKREPAKIVAGEDLDVLVGHAPLTFGDDDDELSDEQKEARKSPVKAMVCKLLKDKYGIEEEDLVSAELEVVPAGRARDCGLDRSLIAGYGHDDRVCAYPSLLAQLDTDTPARTSVTLLVDKEEIGSVGATGMTSRFFENAMAEVLALAGEPGDLPLRRCLARSWMLSSDVSAAFDPSFASVFESKNACYLGHGLTFNKFTGSRGKSGSNDANAEYVARIRRIMNEGGVFFQTAELGKVDIGGGGTIAYILAEYGMQVIDCGVPVLSMHAPWEVVSKADVYEAYRGYKAFLAAE